MFNPTVESIVSALAASVTKLNALAEKKAAECVSINNQVSDLEVEAEASRKERDRASRIARKLEEILK